MLCKVGTLAKRTGLTVRALHHYDAIGLLSPSVRTEAGARLYGPEDLARLHRIQAMKLLGFGLADIQATLLRDNVDPLSLLRSHARALAEKARRAHSLAQGFDILVRQLSDGIAPLPSDWLDSLEMMAIYQTHLTQAEVQTLYGSRHGGADAVDAQWTALVSEVTQAIRRELPSDDPQAQAIAWRWVRLVIAKTDNNPTLAIKLRGLHDQSRMQTLAGVGPTMLNWIGQAIAHARTSLFAKYLTPAQTAELKQRQLRSMSDLDRWPKLMAELQMRCEAGLAVDSPPVQALMREWDALFRESYCGDDPAMEANIRIAFANEPDLMLGVGVNAELMAYIRRASAARLAGTPGA